MKKWIIIATCICIFLTVTLGIIYIQLIPLLKDYGKMEIERFNQLIISHCYMTKVNQLASQIVLDIEKTYAQIEDGSYQAKDESAYQKRVEKVSQTGIIASISLNTLFHLPSFFLLPSIPVNYKHLSSVGSSIVKNIENYGVNHVMIELSIEIRMNIAMVYPFFEQYHTQVISIPILLEIFQGQVPLVYSS